MTLSYPENSDYFSIQASLLRLSNERKRVSLSAWCELAHSLVYPQTWNNSKEVVMEKHKLEKTKPFQRNHGVDLGSCRQCSSWLIRFQNSPC